MRKWMLASLLLAAGCSGRRSASGSPEDKLFESSYEAFVHAAGAHRGGCEIALTAKGDGGKKSDAMSTKVEVDEHGSYHIERDDGWELVRVGLVTWEREKGGKFERVETGARMDLARDDAMVAWRDVLRPMRDRISLKRTGSKKLGKRDLDTYDITVEAGGGADGGLSITEGKGTAELDAETGFPVTLTFEGTWESPATPPAEGRVTWTTEKLSCAITELGGVETIPPAIAPATPAPSPSPSPSPKATPKATPKPGTKKR